MAKDPEVRFGGDASGLKRAAKEVQKSLGDVDESAEKTEKSTSKLGDSLGSMAKDKLGPFGDALSRAGIDLDKMQNGSLVAGAAIAGFAGFVAGGVAKLSELTSAVKQYKAAGDLTADTASRLNAVFSDFGLEVDDGVDAIKTLAEEAGDAPDKFERFGVAIKRTNSGAVDMVQLLADTADRFREIKDPTERAAMGANLFGDNWLRIAPLLEKGGDNFKKLTREVDQNRIANDDLIDQQTELETATRQMHAAVDTLQIALAKDVIPELTQLAEVLSFGTEKMSDAKSAFGGFGDKALQFINPLSQLAQGQKIWNHYLGDGEKAAEDAAPKVDDLSQSVRDQAAATADATQKSKDHAQALNDQAAAVVSLWESTVKINDVFFAAEDAELKYRDALIKATDASLPAEEATRNLLRAADDNAQAQANQAKFLAEAAGESFNAEQGALMYREALVKMRDQTNDSALAAGLDELIRRVDVVAYNAGTAAANLSAMKSQLAGVRAQAAAMGPIPFLGASASGTARATGGPVTAGGAYTVGEQGPEPFVPAQNGRVLSVQQAQQALAGGDRPGVATPPTMVVNVTVNAPVGSSPRDIGRTIKRALDEYTRAGG